MIGMTCSRQQHPSTPPSAKRCPPLTGILSQNLARRLLGKKKNLVPAKRKRSKLSYLNGRRVGLDDSGRRMSKGFLPSEKEIAPSPHETRILSAKNPAA